MARVILNPAAMAALTAPGGIVYRHVERFVEAVRSDAQATSPRDTGTLSASHTVTQEPSPPGTVRVRVGVGGLDYAAAVHQGSVQKENQVVYLGYTVNGKKQFRTIKAGTVRKAQPWLRISADKVNAAGGFGFRIKFKPTRDGG